MAYHYYIYKRLHIHYKDGYVTVVELEKKGAHFWYVASTFIQMLDEDDELYNHKKDEILEKDEQVKQEELRPAMLPILVYDADAFVRPLFETKYRDAVETAIISADQQWVNILKIVKVEEREMLADP